MLQNQHAPSKINTTDQTVHVYACWEIITLHFQALNKLKLGTSLCDVTKPNKNCKHLFSYTEYIFLQENVCLTLLPKNAHGITQQPTLIAC